jgi:hypothetical protein
MFRACVRSTQTQRSHLTVPATPSAGTVSLTAESIIAVDRYVESAARSPGRASSFAWSRHNLGRGGRTPLMNLKTPVEVVQENRLLRLAVTGRDTACRHPASPRCRADRRSHCASRSPAQGSRKRRKDHRCSNLLLHSKAQPRLRQPCQLRPHLRCRRRKQRVVSVAEQHRQHSRGQRTTDPRLGALD